MAKLRSKYNVIIVGTGVAGLNCAINLPANKRVLVICKDTPDKSDSYLAQGGICRLRDDSDFESYYEDTMRAGHYENNPETVKCMIENSQRVISELIELGVDFAKNPDGTLDCTREGGHSYPRICFHADCTGKEITTTLMDEAMSRPNITIAPHTVFLDLICESNECYGIVVRNSRSGRVYKVLADYTVLASGGIGGVFKNSTNFRLLTGDALAVCMNRGVEIENINYIQIHPTTLYSKKNGRRFLISESVRGEGAHLLNKRYKRFTDELQPRDVVTAEIYKQMKKDGTTHVWLDMRPIDRSELESHFPTIVRRCKEEGYDVFTECVPVVPSQHYFMGGIKSDLDGKTTMNRLYAVGETCCNGVHGKNRLASNSLLESLLFAQRAAWNIKEIFSPIDRAVADGVKNLIDDSKYLNAKELLAQYKKQILEAIEKANREDKDE